MRDEHEHPVAQPITHIIVIANTDLDGGQAFSVGHGGVTSIGAATKSGLHANMPYVRVWADDLCVAEFCQHNIVGVYFVPPVAA